jgi:glucose/arabinose dehydrogenase
MTTAIIACSGPERDASESTAAATGAPDEDITPRPLETPTAGATASPSAADEATAAPADSATATAPPPASTTPPVDLDALSAGVELAGGGFSQPDLVTHAGDDSGRTFVLEKTGSIRLLNGTRYLDISDRVLYYDLLTTEHELGLVGLAFHPQFSENGYFYVHYTDLNQDHAISRFTEGPNGLADPASERILLTYDQPEVNFVGGTLAFGIDGFLYIAMGTGTSIDTDQAVAQELDNLWGKLLRIDVDNGDPYAIPSDNPFVDIPDARPEVWAYGLRNPWRFDFDPLTNDLYIGGPGEFAREWVHFVEGGAAAGLNFGWPIIEGSQCWEESPLACDTAGLELPILEYARDDGNCVVIGGLVYRGDAMPTLLGAYLYGDYCSGRIWAAARDADGTWRSVELLDTNMLITSFGRDEQGEAYVCDGLNGNVYRIVAE